MNETMKSMMKPLPMTESRNGRKVEQENALMDFLKRQEMSVCVADVAANIGHFPVFEHADDRYYNYYRRKSISNTFKRLETHGHVVSCLYHGKRYYSIPIR